MDEKNKINNLEKGIENNNIETKTFEESTSHPQNLNNPTNNTQQQAQPNEAYPNQNSPAAYQYVYGQNSGLATASMVLGIISIVLSIILFVFSFLILPLSILSLVFGIIGIKKKCANKGHAVTGVVLGTISIIIALAWISLLFFGLKSLEYSSSNVTRQQEQIEKDIKDSQRKMEKSMEDENKKHYSEL